jgi:hypothetical protein
MTIRDLLVLFVGVTLLAAGVAIRLGTLRRWVVLYRDFRLPWFIRNGAFALLPLGLAFVSAMIGTLALAHRDQLGMVVLGVLAVPITVGGLVVAILWVYEPSSTAKPAWLRANEAMHGAPIDPNPRISQVEKVSLLLIFAPIALAATVILISGVAWIISLLFR